MSCSSLVPNEQYGKRSLGVTIARVNRRQVALLLAAAAPRREEYGKPVDIGADAWVGGGAIILPGVSPGARAVIGAGSVVTRDIPAGVLAVGNPCRVVRDIAE